MADDSTDDSGGVPLGGAEMEDMSGFGAALPSNTDVTQLNEEADAWSDVDDDMSERSDSSGGEPTAIAPTTADDEAQDDDDHDGDDAERTESDQESTQLVPLEHVAIHFGFDGQMVDLKNIAEPSQCSTHPEYRDLIVEAYLSYTTFRVNIFVNYDASEDVFFEGNRAVSCGKMCLPQDKHTWMTTLGADFQFNRIRFDVGTPFRTLAVFDLVAEEGDNGPELKVGAQKAVTYDLADYFIDFMRGCYQEINNIGLTPGLEGMKMRDLKEYARVFLRVPYQDDDWMEWEQPAWGGGEWAGQEEPVGVFNFL